MAGDRYVILGLAHPRSPWFRSLAQWANAASIPAELVKCVSAEELRARLRSGRPHSALVVDGQLPSLDRDLIETAQQAGCAVVVVDDDRSSRDWLALGADSTLPADFDRRLLLEALAPAKLIGRTDAVPPVLEIERIPVWRGKVAMVCGAGGTGTSTVTMALAQALAGDVRNTGMIAIADFARRAEQAVLHDAGDVMPGVQELVEAHRGGHPSTEDVRGMTFAVAGRGYHLLLGLRRPTAWATIRPRAFDASLASLSGAFRVVVCDCDADMEGESDGGSIDVEERNTMARTVAAAADVVFAVGAPGAKGVYALARVIGDLIAFGVTPEDIVPVVNRCPRGQRTRRELEAALDALLPARNQLQPIVYLTERKVDQALRDSASLPSALAEPLRLAFDRATAADGEQHRSHEATAVSPIEPGSLGTLTGGGDDHWERGTGDDRWAAG